MREERREPRAADESRKPDGGSAAKVAPGAQRSVEPRAYRWNGTVGHLSVVRRVTCVMSGDLRTGRVAGRLLRILGMRVARVATVGVLSLAALLLWRGVEPSAPLKDVVTRSAAVASALWHDARSVVAVEQRLPTREAAQPARVGGHPQLLARTRATDSEGDTPSTSALASPLAAPFADIEDSARACLRRLAIGHAPHGEPSPFDATAPPASSPRNG